MGLQPEVSIVTVSCLSATHSPVQPLSLRLAERAEITGSGGRRSHPFRDSDQESSSCPHKSNRGNLVPWIELASAQWERKSLAGPPLPSATPLTLRKESAFWWTALSTTSRMAEDTESHMLKPLRWPNETHPWVVSVDG